MMVALLLISLALNAILLFTWPHVFGKCEFCGQRVRVNKPVFSSYHLCAEDRAERERRRTAQARWAKTA